MIQSKTDITMLSLLLVLPAVSWMMTSFSLMTPSSLMTPLSLMTPEQTAVSTPDPQPIVTNQTVSRASSILPTIETTTSSLPDFSSYRDVRTKKREFFNFMLPMIRQSNDKIREDRSLLLSLRDDLRAGTSVDSDSLNLIGGLSKHYRAQPGGALLNQVEVLLLRVDVVPESLVLAQAANESGWGTSRFAREANNLFGVWCFTQGCGLTPLSRDAGLTHEVARYDSVQDSVDAYVRTINTNPAYEGLRQIRAESRAGAETVSGLALAEGLSRYSARGLDYVREIQQLIRVNNLHEYNLPV